VDDRVAGYLQDVGSDDRVVAESLDAQQAPVGGVADLPQSGQIGQPFAEVEVHGVVDRGLGAERPSFLVVLLDLGVLVEDVQAGSDPVGEDTGREDARGVVLAAAVNAAPEDQADAVGTAQIEVVADDLFEEDPPGDWLVEHLGQGELRLQDGDVVDGLRSDRPQGPTTAHRRSIPGHSVSPHRSDRGLFTYLGMEHTPRRAGVKPR
jgi:hypothetical protein